MHILHSHHDLISLTPPSDECLASWNRVYERRAKRMGLTPSDRVMIFRGHNVTEPTKVDDITVTIPWETDIKKFRPRCVPTFSSIISIYNHFLPEYSLYSDDTQMTEREMLYVLLSMIPNKNGLGVHLFRYLGPVLLELLPQGCRVGVSFISKEHLPTRVTPYYHRSYHIKSVFLLNLKYAETCTRIEERRSTWKTL